MRCMWKRNNRVGAAFAEYVLIIGIAAAAFIMVNNKIHKAVKAKFAQETDYFIGTDRGSQNSPFRVSGGKQLVEQYGVYEINGMTSSDVQSTARRIDPGDGTNSQSLSESEARMSPGQGFQDSSLGVNVNISSLPEYKFEDQAKVPVYVPPFVKAEEGFVQPPTRNSAGPGVIPPLSGNSAGGSSGGYY